ncbi:hypothetical protein Tco_0497617 [Tanacetum coccineum]
METKDTLSSCSNSEEQQMQQIQDKAKESCMVTFRQLHSHLKLLSNNDLKGTRTEYGFKRAFATLFGQDVENFTGTMFLNMDQLEKQLDKEEFQEIGSMAAFKVLETQFQMFIKSRIYLDDEYVVMTRNYFLQYTQLEILEFHDTLIQHMESVKKSIDERAHHKREYDSWVNERQIQTTEEKVDTSKALDVNIRPIYDEEPMAEVQTTVKINVFATGQQHTEQPEFNNEGEVDQNAKQCHDTHPLSAKLTDTQTTELSNQSLKSENICKIFKTVGLRWVPTGKIFTYSTTKVDSEPTNGSNEDIINQYECEQTIHVSACTLNLSAVQHDHSNELSSSKLVPKVVPPADKTATSRQEVELLFHHHITMLRLYGGGGIPFQLKSDSLPHAHAQTTKTYYKHQDSRIKKAQDSKTKTSANSDIQDLPSRYQVYQGRLLASFLDDAKYEHVGQDTRSQGGKDNQD